MFEERFDIEKFEGICGDRQGVRYSLTAFRWLVVAVVVITLSGLGNASARDPSPPPARSEIGIDRSGLSMQDRATRIRTLQDIRAFHATWFRDGPSSASRAGTTNIVDEVGLAKRQGLKVLVNIVQFDDDYDGTLPLNDRGWRAKKLSGIDLKKFAERLGKLIAALKRARLDVDAVEFGNEDDTFYYDADVPTGHVATQAELQTWLRGYGAFLKTGAELFHAPNADPQAQIVTFGMAHTDTPAGRSSIGFSDPAKIVARLKNVDGFDYLDNSGYRIAGYGTHIYASPADPGGTTTRLLRRDVWALGRDKPLWVTEWGFTDATKFPNAAGNTVGIGLQKMIAAFDDLSRRVSLGPLFFYSYDSGLEDAGGKASGLVGADCPVPAASVLSARAKLDRL